MKLWVKHVKLLKRIQNDLFLFKLHAIWIMWTEQVLIFTAGSKHMSHLKLLTFVDWLLKKTQVDADFVQKMDIVTSGIVKIHFNALKNVLFCYYRK